MSLLERADFLSGGEKMRREKPFWLVVFTIIFSATILLSGLAYAETIKESVTSNPSGAEIIWGKTKEGMVHTQFTTPFSKHIEASSWESWCYQVKKECYFDSEVVCRPEDIGDRNVNFELRPLEITIGLPFQDWDIYWGPSPQELVLSGFKTPQVINCAEIVAEQGNRYFLLKKDKNRTGVFSYKRLLAKYYEINGEYAKAIAYYQENLEEFPRDVIAHYGIIHCYNELQDFDAANQWLQSLFKIDPEIQKLTYFLISLKCAQDKQWQDAVDFFQMASNMSSKEDKETELYRTTKNIIERCNLEIEKKNFSEKLRNLAKQKDTIGDVAHLLIAVRGYVEAHNLFAEGLKETTEELNKGKDPLAEGYNISPKLYESQELYEKIKHELKELKTDQRPSAELIEPFQTAADRRLVDPEEFLIAYYRKAEANKGEGEKGIERIREANGYFLDGLLLLQKELVRHKEIFGDYALDYVAKIIKNFQ